MGQQPAPVKHFTLKRKPKSAQLRTELLHKSADAQSSLKKASAPTIPLRSRGMPRKMTDTTPLKGIPSRMPTTGGFRSATTPGNAAQRPNLSRTPAGRKDGGIKLIEFTEQPLGYAAAKKRKREQQLEEQQKKQEQKQQQAAAAAAAAATAAANTTGDSSPTDAATASGGETPVTPTSANNSFEIKTEPQTLNQSSGSVEEQLDEELASKTAMECDTETPEYATATLEFAQATTVADNQPGKPNAEAKLKTPRTPKSVTKVNNNNNNNNSFNHTPKRIKQEIEIKSEEIIVPATIKLEKIEATPSTPQRVIIQQQQPVSAQRTPQLVIRTSPQKRQNNGATTSAGTTSATTTTVGNTTIKMEKLDIKPLLRATGSAPSTSTGTTTTILTPQQLRQAANPLAHLPNNISVKITSAKAKAAAAASGSGASSSQAQAAPQQQQVQVQQSQPPLLINSSTPVILASSPSAQRVVSYARTEQVVYIYNFFIFCRSPSLLQAAAPSEVQLLQYHRRLSRRCRSAN